MGVIGVDVGMGVIFIFVRLIWLVFGVAVGLLGVAMVALHWVCQRNAALEGEWGNWLTIVTCGNLRCPIKPYPDLGVKTFFWRPLGASPALVGLPKHPLEGAVTCLPVGLNIGRDV